MKKKVIISTILLLSCLSAFSQKNKLYDNNAIRVINFSDDFKSNINNWILNSNWVKGEITNGKLALNNTNNSNSTGLSYIAIAIDKSNDFELETELSITNGTGAFVFGMNSEFDHYRLEVHKDKCLLIKNEVSKSKITELESSKRNINLYDFNSVNIRKIESTYYFYFNKEFLFKSSKIVFFGNYVGYSVSHNSSLITKALNQYYIEPAIDSDEISEIKPIKSFPILSISNFSFNDPDNNNCINANENCSLNFTISNSGNGIAQNITVKLSSDLSKGVEFAKEINVGNIDPNSSKQISYPLKSNSEISTATSNFEIIFSEQLGFQPDNIKIQIATKKAVFPMVKVVDLSFNSEYGEIKTGIPIMLTSLIQNIGQGVANNITVNFKLPSQNVYPNGSDNFHIETLNAGETKELVFEFIANKLYSEPNINIDILLKEQLGKYAKDTNAIAIVNTDIDNNKLVISSTETINEKKITVASLSSDVDKNIPNNVNKKENRYALIIGNEDYSSHQLGLTTESNVDFAINDAEIFKEYAHNILGIPEKQIKLLADATYGKMSQGISWISNLSKIENGNAELFIYYSGHGLPDEQTKESYLIPVDVSGLNVKQGIKLDKMIEDISKHPSKRITFLIDACFSGGARNESLIAMKGVKIVPKESPLKGNVVLLSSSTGQESSGVYREQKHGYFTYFMLKKLKETRGNISYKDIADYVILNVAKETTLNSKTQTPQVKYSSQVKDKWETWKFYDE